MYSILIIVFCDPIFWLSAFYMSILRGIHQGDHTIVQPCCCWLVILSWLEMIPETCGDSTIPNNEYITTSGALFPAHLSILSPTCGCDEKPIQPAGDLAVASLLKVTSFSTITLASEEKEQCQYRLLSLFLVTLGFTKRKSLVELLGHWISMSVPLCNGPPAFISTASFWLYSCRNVSSSDVRRCQVRC